MKRLKKFENFDKDEEIHTWFTDIFIDDIEQAEKIEDLPHIQLVKIKTGLDGISLDTAMEYIKRLWVQKHHKN